MGAVTSDLTYDVRAQAEALGDNHPIYKLIGVAGDGELVRRIRIAIKTKNYADIDDFIRTEVSKFLYNQGRGEKITIEKLVLHRVIEKESLMRKMPKNAPNLVKVAETKRFSNTREICSDIEQRGSVGESLLHLCFLNGSFYHKELAKRLLKHYPKMANDIYISDEFYGETALHIAIIDEDPFMVKVLLGHGANVHQRCCGRFFCPEDQKTNRKDRLLTECPTLPVETNYVGYFYFGEYPLSFAAVLNQEECVRLLIANGADINRQDSNGNTAAHMLVIYNNVKMFKMFVNEFNCDLTLKNHQNLSPFTLAAKLAKIEIFNFLLEVKRQMYWVYADISCAAYLLREVDTIADDGTTDPLSALHLVVNGETEDHLKMINGYLLDLLNKKWDNFVRLRFFVELVFFAVYFLFCAACLIMKRIFYEQLSTVSHHANATSNASETSYCIETSSKYTKLSSNCKCAYLKPTDDNRYARTIFEVIIVLYTIAFILIKSNELFIQNIRLYCTMLVSDASKLFFLIALVCILLIVPMRLTCNTYGEDVLVVICIILMSTYFLYFGKGFKRLGTFVFILQRILRNNLLRFFIIYLIFVIGFSQAFYLVFATYSESLHEDAHKATTKEIHRKKRASAHEIEEEVFNTPFQSIMDVFVMSLGDFQAIYSKLLTAPNSNVGKLLFIVYQVLVQLLLVNMLIAMMASTYDSTNEIKREWIRQWAKMVLSIEQNVDIKEKLKQQRRYTHLLSDGEKALIVRWKQTEPERKELNRRKDIFGGCKVKSQSSQKCIKRTVC